MPGWKAAARAADGPCPAVPPDRSMNAPLPREGRRPPRPAPPKAEKPKPAARGLVARLRSWTAHRPRNLKRALLILFDFVALIFNVWLAFCFRFTEVFVPNAEQAALMLLAPLIALPVFVRFGLYRSVLRYLPERAIWTIVQAVTIVVLMWVTVAFLTRMTGVSGIPRTIPVVYWALSITVIAGSRFGTKWLLWNPRRQQHLLKQTLIYGTGDAATQLASALRAARERFVAGFVSEDPSLTGLDVMGIRVYGLNELPRIIANFGIDEVIITTSEASESKRRKIVTRLGALPVKISILPAIADLASGRFLVNFIRDFDLDDLLRRPPVPADVELLRSMIDGRSIMITGAAGSIGSALARTVARFRPARLVLLDFNEHGLYEVDRELRKKAVFPVVPVLGSITDGALLRRVMFEHDVQTVYHCAAYKHVGLVEHNRIEGIRNNVFGTVALAEAALVCGVESFVLISSDKAVRPTSVMGATKRWAELIVRHYGMQPPPDGRRRVFACVRFGNVIGSSGSVVPLFKEQIAHGGPVTVTDDNMTRYFMSVREAAELIVQAGGLAETGDILLLEMGKPIRIRELAEDMISLAGFSVRDGENPDGDIEIVTIGAREGEKIHEELFYDPAGMAPTTHPKILRAKRQEKAEEDLQERLAELGAGIARGDEAELRKTLFGYVAG
jgi:FlaA1/EpsC-like NDP-sugar epimerase